MNEEELKKLEARLAELGNTIDAKLKEFEVKAKDMSKAEMTKALSEAASELKDQLAEHKELREKLQKQVDDIETKMQRANIVAPTSKNFKSAVYQALNDFKGDSNLKDLIHKSKSVELDLKVDDMTEANTLTGAVIPPDRRPGIIYEPERREHVRDLIPVTGTTSSTVTFVYESAFEDNTDVTAEGAEKKQVDFDLAVSTATVRKITNYIIASEEMFDDIEGLTGYISARLPEKLKKKEDYELLYGPNTGQHLYGLTAQATAYVDALADPGITRIDVLVDACRQIRVAEYEATAIVIHPTDAWRIKLAKDSTYQYIQPWIFMPKPIVLDGVPVFITTAITAGQFLVGDFRLGAQIFDRRQAKLEFSYENEDNFVKDMVTVRMSERLTLVVYRAKCFIYGSFTAALAQGSL